MPMKILFAVCSLVIVAISMLSVSTREAKALNCSANISTPINFGQIDVLSGGTVHTEGLLTVTCSVGVLDLTSLLLGIAVCPGIDSGSGGATSSGRLLLRDGSSDTLQYQIFTDANGQTPWGGYSGGLLFGQAPLFRIPASVGTVSDSWPIYLKLQGGQSLAMPGTYRSVFSGRGGSGTEIRYGSLGQLLGCSSLGALLQTSANFTVQAAVNKNCLVSTNDVNFGTHGLLNSSIQAEGAVNLTCTKGTNYSVALETGSLPSNQREMKNSGYAVTYGLYQNSQHTQLWGSVGGESATGSGTGINSSLPVYGLVQPQTTPPAGVYKDTVIVTVTY